MKDKCSTSTYLWSGEYDGLRKINDNINIVITPNTMVMFLSIN